MSTRWPGANVSARAARRAPGQTGHRRAPMTDTDYPCDECWAERDEPCKTGVPCASRRTPETKGAHCGPKHR